VTETITVIVTTTSLTASPNPAGSGQPVTLTATVIPASPGVMLAGSVTFQDGGTAIGTGTLNGAGIATFTTSTLAVGTHTLMATYAGGGSLGGSTAAPFSETIIASAFTLSLTPSTLTVHVGQTGAVTVQLGSVGGYAGTLSLSSAGLPQYVTGTFGSPTLTLQGNGNATTELTLSAQVMTAAEHPPAWGQRSETLTASLAAIMLAPLYFVRRRRFAFVLLSVFVAALLAGASGCSNAGYAINTVTPGTYTIPVIATDANRNSKTANFTLVIVP